MYGSGCVLGGTCMVYADCMLWIATCVCMTCVAMLACQPPAGLLLADASTTVNSRDPKGYGGCTR